MAKKHTVTNRHLGYDEDGLYFVAPIIGKERFIRLIGSYMHITPNWVRQRIAQGGNEKALKALRENPGCMLVLEKKNHDITGKILAKIELKK